MILFRTRHEIIGLRTEIRILKSLLVDYGRENRGYAQIIDELTRFMYNQLAEVRKNNGFSFNGETFKVVPEYGPVKKSDINVGRIMKDLNIEKDTE